MNLSSTMPSEHFKVEFIPNKIMIRNLHWTFPLQWQKKAATSVLTRSHSWIKLNKEDMYYWIIFFILNKLNSKVRSIYYPLLETLRKSVFEIVAYCPLFFPTDHLTHWKLKDQTPCFQNCIQIYITSLHLARHQNCSTLKQPMQFHLLELILFPGDIVIFFGLEKEWG